MRVFSIDEFEEIKLIGQGGFGKVYSARLKGSQKKVAIKEIQNADSLLNEVGILGQLDSCFTIPFLGVIGKPDTIIVYSIVLEFIEGFDLEKRALFQVFNSTQKTIVIRGIVQGICYLHSQKIIHRDIKLSNVLLYLDFQPILIDFGLSCKCESKVKGYCGTEGYIAPEIKEPLQRDGYDFTVDVYSFGILLDIFVSLTLQNDSYQLLPKLEELINHCLEVVPEKRWTIFQVNDFISSNEIFPGSNHEYIEEFFNNIKKIPSNAHYIGHQIHIPKDKQN